MIGALGSQPPVLGIMGLEGPGNLTSKRPEQISKDEWITRARTAWEQSTMWFNSSIRTQIRKNISRFRSLHPEGSKYHHPSFQARSRTFRPKTRALGRRLEAAMAVALFATSDLVAVKAWNQSDPAASWRAKIKQKALQYRLEQDETWWFLTCIGAAQDAFVGGVVISHQYWKYIEVRNDEWNIYRNDFADGTSSFDYQKDSKTIITENRPCVDLIPVERFRFDPACDWRDPVRSSPFLIHEHPTYVGEVRQQVEMGIADAIEPGKFDDTYWWAIASDDYDSIRAAREGSRIDKYAEKKGLVDSQTIAIRKHCQRVQGRDWYWETLGDIVMLKTPRLLTDVFPHLEESQRPYTIGMLVPETHKPYPSAPVQLIENLQDEINDVSNLRQDTVKMATFGRWEVRRNSTVDVATLKAGVPQSVIAVDQVGRDIGELKQRDVPPSAFQETDRLQIDLDDISGGMTQATANSNKALNEDQTLGGMNLLEGQAGAIRELEIRTIAKTWAEPVLQQVHDMIATYESDPNVLSDVAVNNDATTQQVLEALKERTSVRINIGFNATTPEKRIGRLTLALGTIFKLFPQQAPQLASMGEVIKEVMGAVGLDDGERFFPNPQKQDPQLLALRQQVQQLMGMLQGKQLEMQSRKEIAEITANSRVQVATITAQAQYDIALMANKIETNRAYLEDIDRQISSRENDLHLEELQLERTALAHSINQDQMELALKLHEAIHGKAAPRMPANQGPPAMRVAGGDKAGTLARQNYGQIPFQEG